jgi:hypothetical protein
MRLALQAHEGAAVEFERERETGHQPRTVPAAIARPRSKAAVSMAGLPAR